MDPLPVTLIVKAPNQQFEDQTIKCEPTWSIRKLKGYLSEVYPCNPTLDEQKLIYSGQLLNDAHILKDVLRQYEGQDTHTVHLVYTPKNRHMASTTSFKSSQSTRKDATDSSQQARQQTSSQSSQQSQQSEATFGADGLRHRNASAGSNANTSQMPSPPPFMTGYLNMPQPFMPGMAFAQPNANQPQPQYTPEQYALAQQMAMQNMMHQMYLQYMNQYAATMQQQQQSSTAPNVPFIPSNYFPQPNFGMSQQFSAVTTSAPTLSGEQQQAVQPQQDAPPVPPAPRFQPVAADDEAENRDWLEILYTLSRLLVLLSLVYFYSSPGRCSIVIIVIVLYYFYQNHQRNLRERQQLERLQGAAVEADVIDAPSDDNEQQNANDGENNQRNEAESTPLINQETESSTTTPSSPSAEQDENTRLPTLTLVRTFILSFFSSLIPETPAV
ncbi:homocysteine-responsive endoplasmic reticulum-resident ubiquitin-like domain member 2 protein [Sitodiplosis mosellana]|uniref:homocysteine-responsive endoplasmic reticulum-resident ubiquitin-like domain member 2 protein n=1 Tax=Sitodiplosis mosellana TaxID=263140 RepID=UPI002444E4DA|nr:homocysteine-responsive endoplasmic reticulum-resident ubiquitin-like domain member 2 protein [Sitodiplosis mosellana]XP_055298282.1 homocysteine-responsive endoplasmic reticulum-resident ubiquitin-like domain member 2 protein [Sitodiplosis mosellana]